MTEARSHLLFRAGDRDWAISATFAAEVVPLPALTPAPGAPPFVAGVAVLRGEVIPVIELGVLLGGPQEARERAVLVRLPHGPVAFAADRVSTLRPVVPAAPAEEAPVPARYVVESPQPDGSRLWVVNVPMLGDYLTHG
jgi:purine-binding chemotaxis protein CheW